MAEAMRSESGPGGGRARRLRRGTSRLLWGVILSAALLWAAAPLRVQAAEVAADDSILDIIGASEAAGPMSSWAVAMLSAPESPVVSPFRVGDADARRQLVDGSADVIVTGVPFTEAELDDLEDTGRSVIAAPVQGAGMTLLASGPFPSGIDLCDLIEQSPEEDPLNEFPPDCLNARDYVGDLKLTSKDVADVFLETVDRLWLNTEFLSILTGGDPNVSIVTPPRSAQPVMRSDAGMPNLALQTYIRATQPTMWSAAFADRFPPQPETAPAEEWVFPRAPSRNGLTEAVGTIRLWRSASAASTDSARGGAMTMTTPLEGIGVIIAEAEEPEFDLTGNRNQRTPLYLAQLRNGAGEFVVATPDAITTALDAGGGQPFFGLTENVPGAWPLSWVNTMYVPDSGLTGVETNAVAAMIRWQSTVGRAGAGTLGDGRLPEPLVEQALAAADEVVESNCESAGLKTVSTDDPTRFAPQGTLTELGELIWCDTPVGGSGGTPNRPTTVDPIAAARAEVAVANGTSTPAALGSSSLSPIGATGSGSAGAAGSAAAAGSPDAAAGSLGAAAGATKIAYPMPLELPGKDPYDFDRLSTLALGGLMFIGGRWLLRRWGVLSA